MTNPCQGHAAESAWAEKPEALRLADELDELYKTDGIGGVDEAAAELRRLHALCGEMAGALRYTLECSVPMTTQQKECWAVMDSAYKKWRKSK